MGRPKGSGKKKETGTSLSVLVEIVSKLKEYGVSSADLSKKYGKKKPFTEMMLVDLFERHRPVLEKMQVTNTRGRYAGQSRPLNEEELVAAFGEKIAEETGKLKKSKAGALIDQLKKAASNKPLNF